jgi:hypothetical protein
MRFTIDVINPLSRISLLLRHCSREAGVKKVRLHTSNIGGEAARPQQDQQDHTLMVRGTDTLVHPFLVIAMHCLQGVLFFTSTLGGHNERG